VVVECLEGVEVEDVAGFFAMVPTAFKGSSDIVIPVGEIELFDNADLPRRLWPLDFQCYSMSNRPFDFTDNFANPMEKQLKAAPQELKAATAWRARSKPANQTPSISRSTICPNLPVLDAGTLRSHLFCTVVCYTYSAPQLARISSQF
jgi:hypothetical protein